MHRVVVTGLGCISALGHTVEACWGAAREGRSGIARVTLVNPDDLHNKVAAEVKDYDPRARFEDKEFFVLDRFSQFALIAAGEAIADSGVTFEGEKAARTGIILGTGVGGMSTLEDSYEKLYGRGLKRIHPFTIPKLMVNAATSHISMRHGITGPAYSIASACSSANHAIGVAFGMVRAGQVDAMITGGSEAVITMGTLKAWDALRVVAPDTCRPFTVDRKGMVIGEGAGIVVLEPLERAKARGARIYAEVVGFGMSSDAGDIVQPSADGAADTVSRRSCLSGGRRRRVA